MMTKQKSKISVLLLYTMNLFILVFNVYFFRIIFFSNQKVFIERPELWLFTLGFFLFIFLYLFFDKTIHFFMIFEHEFCHLVAAIFTFKPILAFNVNVKSGGHVKIRGENSIIALSPYIIPIGVLIIFMIKVIVISNIVKFFIIGIGFLDAFFLFRLLKEFHLDQPDFKYMGVFVSMITIINLNLVIQTLIFFTAVYGLNKYQVILKSLFSLIIQDFNYLQP